ncbi:MAG TPA: DNA repair protein RecO, partial [Anaerolineales bacterium]
MSDFRSLRLEAVVLRHSDWGEADRLLVLYTRQQGKARAIAKGARKVTSRKAGHLEPFTHVNLQLSKGRDLLIVTQADTIHAFPPIREDLALTGMAAYVIELLDRFIPDEEIAVPELFRLLIETLTRLSSGTDPWLAVRYYEMRLLDFLGFRPRLFECANCGKQILAQDQFFSFEAGGVICPECGAELKG